MSKFIPVESSNIKGIEYQPLTRTLFVHFKNETVYAYFNVPEYQVKSFLNSDSKGKYFHNWIKDTYKFEKVEFINDKNIKDPVMEITESLGAKISSSPEMLKALAEGGKIEVNMTELDNGSAVIETRIKEGENEKV